MNRYAIGAIIGSALIGMSKSVGSKSQPKEVEIPSIGNFIAYPDGVNWSDYSWEDMSDGRFFPPEYFQRSYQTNHRGVIIEKPMSLPYHMFDEIFEKIRQSENNNDLNKYKTLSISNAVQRSKQSRTAMSDYDYDKNRKRRDLPGQPSGYPEISMFGNIENLMLNLPKLKEPELMLQGKMENVKVMDIIALDSSQALHFLRRIPNIEYLSITIYNPDTELDLSFLKNLKELQIRSSGVFSLVGKYDKLKSMYIYDQELDISKSKLPSLKVMFNKYSTISGILPEMPKLNKVIINGSKDQLSQILKNKSIEYLKINARSSFDLGKDFVIDATSIKEIIINVAHSVSSMYKKEINELADDPAIVIPRSISKLQNLESIKLKVERHQYGAAVHGQNNLFIPIGITEIEKLKNVDISCNSTQTETETLNTLILLYLNLQKPIWKPSESVDIRTSWIYEPIKKRLLKTLYAGTEDCNKLARYGRAYLKSHEYIPVSYIDNKEEISTKSIFGLSIDVNIKRLSNILSGPYISAKLTGPFKTIIVDEEDRKYIESIKINGLEDALYLKIEFSSWKSRNKRTAPIFASKLINSLDIKSTPIMLDVGFTTYEFLQSIKKTLNIHSLKVGSIDREHTEEWYNLGQSLSTLLDIENGLGVVDLYNTLIKSGVKPESLTDPKAKKMLEISDRMKKIELPQVTDEEYSKMHILKSISVLNMEYLHPYLIQNNPNLKVISIGSNYGVTPNIKNKDFNNVINRLTKLCPNITSITLRDSLKNFIIPNDITMFKKLEKLRLNYKGQTLSRKIIQKLIMKGFDYNQIELLTRKNMINNDPTIRRF